MDEEQVDVRVGDRERSAMDERLQQALAEGRLTLSEYEERSANCWAARTRRELNELTRDLPNPDPKPEPAPSPQEPSSADDTAPVPAKTGKTAGSVLGSIALTAAALFLGSQVVLADTSAVFSSNTVQAQPGDNIEVGALFGSVEVVVPKGVKANTSGFMVLGETQCEAACAGNDKAQITVDARGGFGSVDVVTPQEQQDGGLDGDEDDD